MKCSADIPESSGVAWHNSVHLFKAGLYSDSCVVLAISFLYDYSEQRTSHYNGLTCDILNLRWYDSDTHQAVYFEL